MTEEVKRHLFEPFFTTKGPGKGTGLGPRWFTVSSSRATGRSRFTANRAWEPRSRSTSRRTGRADRVLARLGPAPRGTETLLLVEDEDGVRALSRFTLQQCGYTILEASHGEEAIRVATNHREKIHLLVTDVVMPGMGGRVLAERLLSLHPEMKVLYLSGYTDDAVVRHGILHEEVNFLQKPFSPNTLAHKVREVLAK
ncbi:MAG: response regulator [Gemmataceae bacterium]